MARCRYCDKEITWLKEGRKNIPVENDGAKHECENFKNARNSYRKLEPNDIDPEILKQYQESMNSQVKKNNDKK